MTWWFIYMIITTGAQPKVVLLPGSPAFHTEEQCTAWLTRALQVGRITLENDTLATCMSPGEDI